MKRIFCFLTALYFSLTLFGQAQITTKKEKLSDFRTKTVKVVLGVQPMLDPALKEAVKNTWIISPFEFCTGEEFTTLLPDSSYYFLFMSETFRKEKSTGIIELRLIKGGEEDIDKALTVTSFPLCSTDMSSGRETVFLPAILHILQRSAEQAVNSGAKVPSSVETKKAIYFAQEDLSEDALTAANATDKVTVLSSDQADELFDSGEDAIFSYVIAPDEPEAGQVSYVMMVDARTHRLCYLRKRKISGSKGVGFQKSDIKAIVGK